MPGYKLFCNLFGILNWLQNNLLSCPLKKLTGYDCPGCGFKRAVIALLHGNLSGCLHLYPAAIPVLVLSIILLVRKKYRFSKTYNCIRNYTLVINGCIISISYAVKLIGYLG